MDVGADTVGHRRRIGDSKVFHAVDTTVLVDNREWIGRRAHLARAAYVMARCRETQNVSIECGVVVEVGRVGLEKPIDVFREGIVA